MSALDIDRLSGVPIYAQIIEQMQKLITAGALRPGEQIPSVRSLSLELSINPNTIQKAYAELELLGITASVPGVGRFVARDAKERLKLQSRKKIEELREAAGDLAAAGVPEEDVLAAVRGAYETVKKLRKEGQN